VSTIRFSEWLRHKVEGRGWLQRDLAAATSVSQQTASRWLLGQTLPNVTHAHALAHALDVTADEVLERLGAPAPATPTAQAGAGQGPQAVGRDLEIEELRRRVERLEQEVARRREA
jgi:transcriptional regulator with XRE-family HTH domain